MHGGMGDVVAAIKRSPIDYAVDDLSWCTTAFGRLGLQRAVAVESPILLHCRFRWAALRKRTHRGRSQSHDEKASIQ